MPPKWAKSAAAVGRTARCTQVRPTAARSMTRRSILHPYGMLAPAAQLWMADFCAPVM